MGYNVCIVGLGRQGNVHLRAAVELHSLNIVSDVFVSEIDYAYSKKMQEIFPFKLVKDFHILPQDTIFVLSAPNNVHPQIINKIRDSHKYAVVLKEKPLTHNIKYANNKSANVETGSNLVVAQQRYFNASYILARSYLNDLGKILFFDYEYTLNDLEESWYWDKDRGGGCYINVAWHFIFLINWFFGEPQNMLVKKLQTNRKSFKYDTDDTTFIDISYSDFFGKAYMSVSDSSKQDSFRIIGEKGTIEVNKKECVVYNTHGTVTSKHNGNEELSYIKQLHLIACQEIATIKKLTLINKVTDEQLWKYND